VNDGDEVDSGTDPLNAPDETLSYIAGGCSVTGGAAGGSMWLLLTIALVCRRRDLRTAA
jgi:hypothetical protein